MGECTKNVNWLHKPTYEDVKKLYANFENAASSMGCDRMHLNFNFSCGSFGYTAETIEEFTEKAYGEGDFKLIALQFRGTLNTGASVRINYLCTLSLSATTKVLLESFENRLNLSTTFCEQAADSMSATVLNNTVQGASNSPITVNGSGNIINVAGRSISGCADVKLQENKKEEKKDFAQRHPIISAIVASVLAGIILLFNCWETFVEFIETVIGSLVP